MGGKKAAEQDDFVVGEDYTGVEVAGVDLDEEFAAGATGGENCGFSDGDDEVDFGFA